MAIFGYSSSKDERFNAHVDMKLTPYKGKKNLQIVFKIKSGFSNTNDYILCLKPEESQMLKLIINGLESE